MRIESRLSSASVDDHIDSPTGFGRPHCTSEVLILHLVDEDVVELADNDGYDNDAENPPWGDRHPISLPPPGNFSVGVEKIRRLGVLQWPQFGRDRIFLNVPHITAAARNVGNDNHDCSSCRGRGLLSPLNPPSPTPSRCDLVRTPSIRSGGVWRYIPAYANLLNSMAVCPSSQGGNRGMAKSSPLNYDMEPERADGRPSGSKQVASSVVSPVGRSLSMVDAICSSLGRGNCQGSESLKRHLEDVLPEEASGKKPQKDPYARVFCTTVTPRCERRVRLCQVFLLAKLEDMFTEKEARDDKVKELVTVAKELASAVETVTAKAESLQADLGASINREAILQAQIGDQQETLDEKIAHLDKIMMTMQQGR
ncbi:BnaA07g37010D [Brassica napus]|uniref:(rape) hypothetical protein n=1 Tax=Brassica napus TaxID=3708 RepID=A0A078IPU4_BRANA|nr:unnamed protein product [Brassica napus]CDY51118.1 BnaA07g37010D [Brassica napus]